VLDVIGHWQILQVKEVSDMFGTALIVSESVTKQVSIRVHNYDATDEEWDREERYIDSCLESNTPTKKNTLPHGILITLKIEDSQTAKA
jgi:hypothetical protein